MNFLFVCGGTAGHINPALAIAEEVRRVAPDSKVLFVGAGKEMEKRLIPQAGFHLVNINMSGFRRSFKAEDIAYNLGAVRSLTAAGLKADKLISKFKPHAVIGTGGYICYPVMRRAARRGIPTVVHESNAVPGLTTKLLSATVDKVLISFPGLEEQYRRPGCVVLTGTPVRGGFSHAPASDDMAPRCCKPLVVSFWGSLGAERMNEVMTDFILRNIEAGSFYHIHAAGKGAAVDAMKNRLRKLGGPYELPLGIEIREYINDMQSVMAKADLVMCRAGGSTIAELTCLGKPALLIPSPYVTNDQQMKNAKQVEKAGGAIMLQEKDCTGEILYNAVSSILGDERKRGEMSVAQKALGVPDSAGKIVGIIMELCKRREEGEVS